KALTPLENVTRTQPANPDAREMLAEVFVSLKQFDQAAEQFQRLAEIAPDNPRAWDGLRRSCEARAGEAAVALREIAPDSPYWQVIVAETRVTFDAAFYWYRQALARMPGLRGVHRAVAEIYRKTGHPDWAAIEEEKERQLPPLNCGVSNAVAQSRDDAANSSITGNPFGGDSMECAFLAGQYGEVIAATKDLNTPEAYYWQARAYNARAQDAFARLRSMQPSAQLHQVLAKTYLDRRLYSQSAKEWQEALNLSPGDRRIQKGLAVALSLSGDFQAARTTLEDLVRREPDSAELNYMLGDILLNSDRAGDAIPPLQKAVELDPGFLPARKSPGRALLKVGNGERAIPHLRAALPADEDGSLYYQLARAYRSMGQQDLAGQMLEKFQEIQKAASAEKKVSDQKIEITPP
ncbi:MAG: tetratricopeptide repeat protein, partial [Methylocella sp.]